MSQRCLYLVENVGIEALTMGQRTLGVYENVGVEAQEIEKRTLELAENVGIESLALLARALYAYEAVTDDTPFPYLEKITPNQGPEGTEIMLTGDGFGDTQGEFDSDVLLDGGIIGITSWAWKLIRATIPPGAESGQVVVIERDPAPERQSQGKFFLVTEYALGDAARLEVKLYSGNTLLAILDGAK